MNAAITEVQSNPKTTPNHHWAWLLDLLLITDGMVLIIFGPEHMASISSSRSFFFHVELLLSDKTEVMDVQVRLHFCMKIPANSFDHLIIFCIIEGEIILYNFYLKNKDFTQFGNFHTHLLTHLWSSEQLSST